MIEHVLKRLQRVENIGDVLIVLTSASNMSACSQIVRDILTF